MRKVIAVILCAALLSLGTVGKESGYNVVYDGGSVSSVKNGAHVKLQFDQQKITVTDGKNEVVNIPPSAVTEISYGQDVHRRVGAAIGLAVVSFGIGTLMALTKSKKHYVGLTWATHDDKGNEVKGGFAMQCDKNEYRGILMGLEGITGKKSVDSDQMTVKN